MGTFFAGLRSRRWLNVGVFVLGVLAMLVAVATPLYARCVGRAPARPAHRAAAGLPRPASTSRPAPLRRRRPTRCGEGSDDDQRQQMLDTVSDLITSTAADAYWQPPTTYLLSRGEYRLGGRTYQINTYWRDGMCDDATSKDAARRVPTRP